MAAEGDTKHDKQLLHLLSGTFPPGASSLWEEDGKVDRKAETKPESPEPAALIGPSFLCVGRGGEGRPRTVLSWPARRSGRDVGPSLPS